MTNLEIARRRLCNHQLSGSADQTPVEIVRRMGAVQAQDYSGAKWAVALRAGANDSVVEQAVNAGAIMRLHVLRPTWHFVAAEDVRWLLALTGPRVIKGSAARYRQLELDEPVIVHSQEVFRRILSGGLQLTRFELEVALQLNGISTAIPQRMAHLLMRAELDGVLCSGGWIGKQNTYALLDERVPFTALPEREAALAELSRRFFTSHGPAQLKDFAWWSGLTIGDARTGIELAGISLVREEIDKAVYWSGDVVKGIDLPKPTVHLLPNYDEYVVAYTDRSAIFDPALSEHLHLRGGVLNPVILLNGLVAGGWTREVKKSKVTVRVNLLWEFSPTELRALELAVRRYGEFLDLPATLER